MNGYGKRLLLFLVLTVCFLVSCRTQPQPPEEDPNAIRLYFLNSQSDTGSAIASEPYAGGRTATVRTLVNTLLSGPTREGLSNPFPSQTTLRGWGVEDGLLTLDLSEHYGDLSGIDLTLADYCITLTLCQLEGVERVRITVAGSALAYRGHDVLDPSEVMLDGLVPSGSEGPGGEEPPGEEPPGEEPPGEEPPGEELPGEEPPGEELPDPTGLEDAVPDENSPAAS